ncbi:MAG: DUF4156 domain-containing protein [Gammaproteobacteria bacterium]|nr:DUF4156 domain-containing protein [Gammaproteobacteria bacterium]
MYNKRTVFVLLAGGILNACTWVHLSDNAKSVRVVTQNDLAICKKMATTTANLVGKILGMNRSKEKVQSELETLARNSAADLGGNAIFPVSDAVDGKQTFIVYECP